MTLAALIAALTELVPLVEEVVKDSPALVADFKKVVAAIEGKSTPAAPAGVPSDPASIMAPVDNVLKQF